MQGTIAESILISMRRLLTFAVLAALTVPAASAARPHGMNDGTLSVRDARGAITISARGGVIGSFAQGRVTIIDPIEGDGTGPIVSGEEFHREVDAKTDVYRGAKVRFRIIGGKFTIRVQGRGINLSLVGKGNVILNGAGAEEDGIDDDGTYSVNGGEYSAIPDLIVSFALSATSP
jgi:hypothetical protein